ncbi:MAG: molybdopterin-dependent oxidoreductase, partial [Pseudomonadota bacterium]
MTTTTATICRVCHAQCPAEVTVADDGRATRLDGIRGHPIYHGYACAKGRALPSYHYMPERLLRSQQRHDDGVHRALGSDVAIDAVATRLGRIVERHGPRAVALYNGTHGYNNFLSTAFGFAFMEAIGSPMVFTSVTIDQPGKAVSGALHGTWLAGHASIDEADCWMFVGANPVISMLGPVNPAHALKRNQARGMQLIVVDPRRSEVARRADVFLQARPGQDALILAAMLKVIFDENLADREFLAAHVEGTAALQAVLATLDIAAVAARAGLTAEALVRAARTYAGARSGVVAVGTGPNMAGHGNLTEYLSRVLMSVCGHWLRPGDNFANPGALLHPLPPIAAASGAMPAWGFGEPLRVRGLTDTAAGMPTAALSDEILLDGDGRVRALIVVGGNPLLAWPDQLKTREALEKLELLVCLDTLQSATGDHADVTVAVKTHLEVAGLTALQEACRAYIGWGYWAPYAQYCAPAVAPPPGSDLIEEWEFFRGVADRLGAALTLKPASWAFHPDEQAARAFTPRPAGRPRRGKTPIPRSDRCP